MKYCRSKILHSERIGRSITEAVGSTKLRFIDCGAFRRIGSIWSDENVCLAKMTVDSMNSQAKKSKSNSVKP